MDYIFGISYAQSVYLMGVSLCILFQLVVGSWLHFGKSDMAVVARMTREEKLATLYLRVGLVGYVCWMLVATAFFTYFFLTLGWYVALVVGLIGGAVLMPFQFYKLVKISKNQDALNRAKLFMDYDLQWPSMRSLSVKRGR
jgi:ABC-type transport system involved in cytochrome bd biosynthesis fused ATPase/permease subunit